MSSKNRTLAGQKIENLDFDFNNNKFLQKTENFYVNVFFKFFLKTRIKLLFSIINPLEDRKMHCVKSRVVCKNVKHLK